MSLLTIKVDVSDVVRNLQANAEKYESGSIEAGFGGPAAPYAIFVHENTEMRLAGQQRPRGQGRYWDAKGGSQGRSKYLEEPARTQAGNGVTAGLLADNLRGADGSMSKALRAAADSILREALEIVPYHTGRLHNSAFLNEPQVR